MSALVSVFAPQNYDQAVDYAERLSRSGMVPKDFINKPDACLIAMQWGSELGLGSLQAIQNIAVINGRPTLWGDAALALVLASAVCEYVKEAVDAGVATCTFKRRGGVEQSRAFSRDDAKRAGLLGKAGPWTQYETRMLQLRARGFALRDGFADVLRGLITAEEARDMPSDAPGVAAPAALVERVVQPLPFYSDADFEKNMPAWEKSMQAKRKTPADVCAMLRTRYQLTPDQVRLIEAAGATLAAVEVSGNDDAPTLAQGAPL